MSIQEEPLRVAVVGSGPSGFYAAGALLAAEDRPVEGAMLQRLPTPWGPVRSCVARMLSLWDDELRPTDVGDHALDALRASRIRDVTLLGRRGPVEAAFTTPELRELGALAGAEVVVDPADLPPEAADEGASPATK